MGGWLGVRREGLRGSGGGGGLRSSRRGRCASFRLSALACNCFLYPNVFVRFAPRQSLEPSPGVPYPAAARRLGHNSFPVVGHGPGRQGDHRGPLSSDANSRARLTRLPCVPTPGARPPRSQSTCSPPVGRKASLLTLCEARGYASERREGARRRSGPSNKRTPTTAADSSALARSKQRRLPPKYALRLKVPVDLSCLQRIGSELILPPAASAE